MPVKAVSAGSWFENLSGGPWPEDDGVYDESVLNRYEKKG